MAPNTINTICSVGSVRCVFFSGPEKHQDGCPVYALQEEGRERKTNELVSGGKAFVTGLE